MPCDEMSADWAAQRIKGLSLWGAVVDGLKRSLGLNKRPNDGMQTKTLLETFRYPRLGPGMMWDAARDKIIATGKGQVLMDHGLKQLASDNEGGWRMTATGPVGDVVIRAAHAISSAPMRELAARLHPLPATSLNAKQLKYRDFLTVALKIRADEDMFPDNWIYIHDSKVKVGRIQNFRRGRPKWSRTRAWPASAWNTSASKAMACGRCRMMTWSNWPPAKWPSLGWFRPSR